MSKRCPPGVLCIENVTIIIVVIIFALIILFLNWKSNPRIIINEKETSQQPASMLNNSYSNMPFNMPFNMAGNMPEDVLLNPYQPPLRDDRYIRMPLDIRGGIPINIPTQSVDTSYRQVGLLTRVNGSETILPLMGRPLFTNRDKWNFYTMSDKNNSVKLPISNKGRSCTNEYGCDNLYNGDTVYVEGYNDAFKVTVYDNQIMRYLPFL
jgi:hypothetical protein